MALAYAPKRVQSLQMGSHVESRLNEAVRKQSNVQAQLSRLKIGNQPPHLQATMLSEKLRLEDEVHDLTYVIDQLRLERNKVQEVQANVEELVE